MQAMRPWPYTRPVVVLSSSLAQDDLPEDLAGKVRVCDAAPEEAMRMLHADGKQRAYVDGGLVIQSFLRAGLIADMVITRVLVLLGGGRSLFGSIAADIPVFHEETRSFPPGWSSRATG
nr:dihydrofolate reductase family protein [Marinicella sp. W31]MDC2879996.1 dihydrofolate reductase family protein [Marinicella sp. W31]